MNEHCGCENTAVQELESGLKRLSDTSYNSIDKLMRKIMKKHDMTAKQLHNSFIDKHKKTPDTWIKDMKESLEVAKQGLEGKRFCRLCRKSETAQECKFGVDMWNKYSIATVHPGNMPEQNRYPKLSTIQEDHVAIAMGKMLDTEGAMIKNQLETIERSVALLRAQIKSDDMQVPAWVQAKVTLATENILVCANYMAGKEEEVKEEVIDEKRGLWDNINARRKKGLPPKKPGEKGYPKTLDIDEGLKQARANVGASKCWTGKKVGKPPTKMKGGKEVPNCVPAEDTCLSFSNFMTEVAAWQRKEGKNQSGGLNEKGRKSYEREHPGSDLKAPSKKVGNPRRASFCARMKGMKSKLTSAKTARDPDSRINKSLRAWNC